MSITEQFTDAVDAAAGDLPGLELLPERLALACAQVLPVDGAGISLFFAADRRLPLGASDRAAADAERLQFTVGDGPCLSSFAEGHPILADEDTIRTRWPAFHDSLVTRTPIRSVVSLPLHDEYRELGVLDLYLVPPRDLGDLDLDLGRAVAGEVTAALRATNGRSSADADGPAWLDAPAAGRRSLVWQAIGFVNSGLGVGSPDALAMLRAHAYSEGLTLDDLAARVVDRDVPLERLSVGADTAS
jgi:hypothetical protein